MQDQLSKHMATPSSNSSVNGSGGGGGANNTQNWDYPELANAALSDMFGCPPEMMHKIRKMMPSMMAGGGPMSGMPFPGMAVMSQQHGSPPMDLSSQKSGVLSRQQGVSGSQEPVTHTDLNKWREKQYEVMSKYMHNKETPSTSDQSSISGSDISPVSQSLDEANSSKENSPKSEGVFDSGDSEIISISIFQQERLERYRSYTSLQKETEMVELISEVQNGIIESHLEHCYHQRPRINAINAELDAKQQVGGYTDQGVKDL